MCERATPYSKTMSTGTKYYEPILAQFKTLIENHPEPASVTFCWMQGERDAREQPSVAYQDALATLIANLRREGRDERGHPPGRREGPSPQRRREGRGGPTRGAIPRGCCCSSSMRPVLVADSRRSERLGAGPWQCGSRCAVGADLRGVPWQEVVGDQRVSPGDYIADTVLDGAGVAVSLRGGDGFIGRRPKRRTVSTHAERSRPSRSRIGATVEGMRPRLPFTI